MQQRRLSPLDRKSTRLNSSHTEIYPLSLHDALPISKHSWFIAAADDRILPPEYEQAVAEHIHATTTTLTARSEEHTSELQSHRDLPSFPTRRSSDLKTFVVHCRSRRPDIAARVRAGRSGTYPCNNDDSHR